MITASHNPPTDNGLKVSKRGALPVGYESGLAEVERVYNERIGVYRSLADITVRNDQGYHMAVYTLTRLIRERF